MKHSTNHTRTIGICEAARQLGKSPGTISKYVTANPSLNRGSKGRPRVDLDELRQHRLVNINQARTGSHAGRLLGEGEAPPPAATRTEAPPNYAYAKAVRETVLADRARLDLDERRRLLVPRREIETAIYDAGAVLQRDLLELAGRLAERIATMDNPREIAALVEAEHRNLLSTFATSLRDQAAAEHEPRPCP